MHNEVRQRILEQGRRKLQSKLLAVCLASFDRRPKDVAVLSIVVAELKLGNIERHVFGAHLVERAHHAALEDRPEAFDCLSVNSADYILTLGVIDSRVREILSKAVVTNPLIGAEQADLVRNCFAHEFLECAAFEVFDNASDDVPLRLTAPTIGVLPDPVPPVPPPFPRLSICLFLARPPTKVSSTSTIPPSLPMSVIIAARILWHIDHAVS
jgi:hypothetical protein